MLACLQDIRDKYPPWLEVNRATLSADDVQRYSDQYASIQAVCNQYETDPANFSRLVELIQQVGGQTTREREEVRMPVACRDNSKKPGSRRMEACCCMGNAAPSVPYDPGCGEKQVSQN